MKINFLPRLAMLAAIAGAWEGLAADTVQPVDAAGQTPNRAATALMPVPIFDFAVHAVSFSPDGETLTAGTGDGAVHLWETKTRRWEASLAAHEDWTFAVKWFPDGERFVTGGGDNLVRIFRRTGLALPGLTLAGHTGDVHAVAITRDGKTLLSAGDDRRIILWDVEQGKMRKVLGEHARQIPTAALDADSRWAATGSRDGTIKLWSLDRAGTNRVLTGHGADVMSVAFSPDGQYLASASYDRTVRLWNLTSGMAPLVFEGHTNRVFGVAFSPDGKVLASAGDSTVRVWEMPAGKLIQVVRPGKEIVTHSGNVAENISSVAFDSAGEILAAGSTAGVVYLLDWKAGTVKATLEPPRRPMKHTH